MMRKILIAILLTATPAMAASHGWICQVNKRPVRYEIKGQQLLGFEDDYSPTPRSYKIESNDGQRLVASRPRRQPSGATAITIDKVSRRFAQDFRTPRGLHWEMRSGFCAPFRAR